MPKVTQPRMYGRNGKGMWKMPTKRAYEPEGVTLGATVAEVGACWRQGQVWSKAPGAQTWWIVTADGSPWLGHELDLTVLGQIGEPELSDELSA